MGSHRICKATSAPRTRQSHVFLLSNRGDIRLIENPCRRYGVVVALRGSTGWLSNRHLRRGQRAVDFLWRPRSSSSKIGGVNRIVVSDIGISASRMLEVCEIPVPE